MAATTSSQSPPASVYWGAPSTTSSVAGPAAWKDADAADDDAEEAEEADEAEEAGANEAGVLSSGTTSGCRGAE